MNGSEYIEHYWIKENPGEFFQFTIAPTASSTGGSQYAEISYGAEAEPLDIHFKDENGEGEDEEREYWIGQNVVAELVTPLDVSGYASWTTSGGGIPFGAYVVTQDTGIVGTGTLIALPSPEYGPEYDLYYARAANPTINCSGTLLTPEGSVPSSLNFEIERDLTTRVPSFLDLSTGQGVQGGDSEEDPVALAIYGTHFYNPYSSANQNTGIWFSGKLGEESGKFNYIQLISIDESRSGPAGSQVFEIPIPNTNPVQYFTSGLDVLYPANPHNVGEDGYYIDLTKIGHHWDEPLLGFSGFDTNDWTYVGINDDTFESYLMYKPPGTASMDVPIAMWSWTWDCYASFSSGWTAPITSMTAATKHEITDISHPQWTRVVTPVAGVWH